MLTGSNSSRTSIKATSLQRPLSSAPKLAVVERSVGVYIRSAHLIFLCLPNRFIFDNFESHPWKAREPI